MKISESFYKYSDPSYVAAIHDISEGKKQSPKKLIKLLHDAESFILMEQDLKATWACLMVERWCDVYSTMELLFQRLTLYERVIGKDFMVMKEITRWCQAEFRKDFFGFMRILISTVFPQSDLEGEMQIPRESPKTFLQTFYSEIANNDEKVSPFRLMLRILAFIKLSDDGRNAVGTSKETQNKFAQIREMLRSSEPVSFSGPDSKEYLNFFSITIKAKIKVYKLVKKKMSKEVFPFASETKEPSPKEIADPKRNWRTFKLLEINGFLYLVKENMKKKMGSNNKTCTGLESDTKLMTLETEEDREENAHAKKNFGSLIRPFESGLAFKDLEKGKEAPVEKEGPMKCKVCLNVLNSFTKSPFKGVCRLCYIKYTCDNCYTVLEEPFYCNKNCHHRFCNRCLCDIVDSNKELLVNCILDKTNIGCVAKRCRSIFDLHDVDRYFEGKLYIGVFQASQLEVTCFSCKEKGQIPSNSKGKSEYYQCKACKAITCLYHQKPASECLCICVNCLTRFNQETVSFQIFYKCQKCPGLFCARCKMRIKDKASFCKCKCTTCYELLPSDSPAGEPTKCEKCNKTCDLCFIDYKLGLSRFCKLCGKGFCKSCVLTHVQIGESSKKSQIRLMKEKTEKLENILTTAKKIDRGNFCLFCK